MAKKTQQAQQLDKELAELERKTLEKTDSELDGLVEDEHLGKPTFLKLELNEKIRIYALGMDEDTDYETGDIVKVAIFQSTTGEKFKTNAAKIIQAIEPLDFSKGKIPVQITFLGQVDIKGGKRMNNYTVVKLKQKS